MSWTHTLQIQNPSSSVCQSGCLGARGGRGLAGSRGAHSHCAVSPARGAGVGSAMLWTEGRIPGLAVCLLSHGPVHTPWTHWPVPAMPGLCPHGLCPRSAPDLHLRHLPWLHFWGLNRKPV